MKNSTFGFLSTLLVSALLATVSSARSAEAPRLQVTVETPTVFDIMHESDIADALAVQLRESFRRGGFEGRIAQVERSDEITSEIPLITVRLTDWRRRHSGFIDCRFTAKVTTRDGESINLGAFNGRAVTWNHTDRFRLSKGFEDAAHDAMRELYRDYRKLDIVTVNAPAE